MAFPRRIGGGLTSRNPAAGSEQDARMPRWVKVFIIAAIIFAAAFISLFGI